jgi:ketosteroid isomerase-like protein
MEEHMKELGPIEVSDKLLRALEAKDAKEATAVFAEDPVVFTMTPEQNSEGEEDVKRWLDGFVEGPRFETADRHLTVDGDVAFSYGLVHLRGKKVEGEVVDVWYRETNCFRRINGDWKIIHSHESIPFMKPEAQL